MAFRTRKDPPKNESDFERLCLKLLKRHWLCDTLELYGHRGERQHGIDILEISGAERLRAGQCKLYDARKTLPPADIEKEVDEAKGFAYPLRVFALLTTAKVSTQAQNKIVEVNKSHRELGLFSVELFTWDRIEELLDEYPEVRDEEYKTIGGAAVQRLEEGITDIKLQLQDLDSVMVANSADTADALHASIDEARTLIQRGDPQTGRFLLQRLRGSKWERMGVRHRFRLLSNIGAAYLKEQKFSEAADCFLQAAELQPDDVQAAENEALAYNLSLQSHQAFEKISALRSKFPASSKITAFWALTAPPDRTVEIIQESIEITQQRAPEVLNALAVRALSDGRFALASSLAADSVQQRPSSWFPRSVSARAYLLGTLPKLSAQSAEANSELLRKAEALFTNALNAAVEQKEIPGQLESLIERSQVRILLREFSGADDDVHRAVALLPQDLNVRRAVADMKLRHGQADAGIADLRGILGDSFRSDIAIRLADALRERGATGDAFEAAELLRRVLTTPGPTLPGGREYVASILLLLLATDKKWSEGERLCDQLAQGGMSPALISAYRAKLKFLQGERELANEQANVSLAALSETAPPDEVRWIAHLLSDLGRHAEAFPLWGRIASRAALTQDTKSLVNCSLRLGRDGFLLDLCSELRKSGVMDRQLVLLDAETRVRYDVDGAIEVLTQYLWEYPEDKIVRLHRSFMGLNWNRRQAVDADPAVIPVLSELDNVTARIAVQVMKLGGHPDEALEQAYELLRRRFNEPEAHRTFMFNLHPIEPRPAVPQFSEVQAGAAVCYVEDGEVQEKWLIIEDSANPDSTRSEVSPDRQPALGMLGKRVGETVVLAKGSISDRKGTIRAILSKYVFRYQDCLANWQLRFPQEQELESVKVIRQTNEGREEADFSAIFASVERHSADMKRLLESYRTQPVTIPMLADFLGKNAIQVTLFLAENDETQVYCCNGTAEERTDAFQAMETSSVWVIEPCAIATILRLNLEDELQNIPVKFVMTQGSQAELNEILNEYSMFTGERGTITKIRDRIAFVEFGATEQEQRRQQWEERISKLRSYIKSVASLSFANIDAERRKMMVDIFGTGGAESIVIASQPGHLLWTDDARLGAVARKESGVKPVWTQAILQWAATKGYIDEGVLADASARLLGFGYYFTSPNVASMMSAAKIADWNPSREPLSAAIRQLGTDTIGLNDAAVLAIAFIKAAYIATTFDETRRRIVSALLDQLAVRQNGMQTIAAIRSSIPRVFGLNLIGATDVLETIDSWLQQYPLRVLKVEA